MGTPLDTDVSATADQVKNRLFDCIDALTEALVADEPICARLQSVSDVLGALGKAADDEGLAGLIEAAALVADRISAVGDDEARQETVFVLLAQLPLLLMDYVLSPADLGAGDALVGFLQSDDWGVVMDDEEVDLLRMLLQPPPDMDDENSLSAPARQRVDAPMAPEVAALAAASPASAFIGCPAAQSEESAPTPPAATFMPPDTQVQAVTSDMLAPAVEAFEAVELAAAQEPPAAQHRPVAADALDVSAALPNDIDNLSLTPTANEEVDSLRTPLQPPPELEGESPLSAPEFALNEPPMEPDVTAASADSLATAFSAALDTESEEPAPTPSAPAFVLPTTAVQSVPNEMLALAVEAFEANYVGLLEALAIAAEHEPDRRRDGREQLRDELERLAAGAETIGLAVLAQLLSGIHAALGAWQPDPGPAQDGVLTLLATLPEYLRGYLSAPTDRPAAEALVRLIGDLDVGATLFGDHAELLSALTAVELAVAPLPEGQHRPLVADPLDLSLGLPEDINQELLEGLLTELPIQTAAFTEAVHRIASGRGGVADIEIAKRAAHTLKGAANTVGIKGIATLTHSLEDILVELAEHSALPNPGLSQTLTHAADCLEGMSEALAGLGEPPADAVNVLQDVLDWANRLDAEGIAVAAADPSDTPVPAQSDEHPVEAPHHRQDHAIAPMLRVPTTLVDEQLRLLGESMTSTAQIQNRLQSAMQQVMAVNLQNQLLRQLVNELEDLVDLRGIALPQPVKADTGFDALEFDQYGELHTVTRRLVEVTTDASEMSRTTQEYLSNLGELVGLQTRLHLANQDAVLRSRMVPVVSVVARLQRAVRQAGRLLDKEVHLVLKGTETLIDSSALNALVEALMHVLRNAVDHGIEPVEVRLARGKDPIGHIELAFKREGEVVSVTCRDDGQGLDLNHLRLVAQRRNLVGSTDVLSDDQVARFILIAGFSTRHDATQVSGRGIGLDAVNTMVEDLKGSIRLRNQPSHGLTVEIRLPTTLLSAQVLLIRLPGAVLALTTRGIEGIHFATADQFQTVGAQLAYRQGDQLHDVVQLLDLLNIGHGASKVQAEQAVLMVRMSSGASTAVTVAAIAESRSVVVKKLGPYVGQIGGVIGATILGDGSVAPVIDLPDLLRAASRAPRPAHGTALPRADAVDREVAVGNARTALVVDDSLSARRMTAQLFRDAGFEVQTAIDGLDAVAILNRSVPDVILTDLEMPRMNGLELTAHIRANPRTQQVPIVMITSRSTEKHRQQAFTNGVDRYLTKPFSAEELLSQVGTLTDRAAPQP